MEIFKDIPGYKGYYQISNLGNVKSFHNKKEKILKLNNAKGYLHIELCKNKHKKRYKVHRLVMFTFIGYSKLQVNHKNGIKDDNRLENLEYCTDSENKLHSFRILGYKSSMFGIKGKNNPLSKSINQYTKEGKFIKTWDCIKDAGKVLSIHAGSITEVCKGIRKTAGGFIWKYK